MSIDIEEWVKLIKIGINKFTCIIQVFPFIEKEESDQHKDVEEVKVQNSMKMECRCGADNCRKILFG